MSTKFTKDEILTAINSTKTMSDAARLLNMSFMSFRYKAKKLGVYKPNQWRIGIKRASSEYSYRTIPLNEILDGLHPTYKTYNLKIRLIKEGLKKEKCEGKNCNVSTLWNNKPIVLQLDHIDGNSENHRIDNLRLLCPNCHSQTETWGFKKRYETEKLSKLKLKKQKYIVEQSKYIDVIKNSNITFNKLGWVNEVATILNITPQKVNTWMKRFMLEFYTDNCFKRK